MARDYNGIKIYHYTNFVALNGILNGDGIRLCDIRFMNDKYEIKQFLNILQNDINKRLVSIGKEELIECADRIFKEQIEHRKDCTLYASCFSECSNDAAQWERYGNNGSGVMIGFNAKVLEQIISGAIILQTVFYTDCLLNNKLAQIITDYIIDPSKPIANFSSINGVFDNVWACSGAFKHSSFKNEKEIRLLSLPIEIESYLGKPYFLVKNDIIRKYYTINIKELCIQKDISINKLITSITIGPKSTQSINVVKDFLIEKGLESLTKFVYKSDCPLR